MHWKTIPTVTLLAIGIAGVGFTTAQDKVVEDSRREADRVAIDKLTREMIQAFEKRDAAAIAAIWTDDGEFCHNGREPVRGRADIQKGYAEFFQSLKGKPKLEVQSDAVRFPSADMAVTETTLRLKSDDGETTASGRQETVLVREGDRWKVALVREWDHDLGLDVSLKDIDWLIGSWQAATADRAVSIAYEWDENKAFIRGKFTVKEGAKVAESGTELIGRDNAEGVIRSWVFQSDGGLGGGAWRRQGRTWSIDVHGVRPDGKKLTGTVIYIPVDANTITWQAVNQTVDGVAVADTAPIKVTKQKSAK